MRFAITQLYKFKFRSPVQSWAISVCLTQIMWVKNYLTISEFRRALAKASLKYLLYMNDVMCADGGCMK